MVVKNKRRKGGCQTERAEERERKKSRNNSGKGKRKKKQKKEDYSCLSLMERFTPPS